MTDFISASPLLILAVLVVISWFTGSKALKLLTVIAFFFIPVLTGKVSFNLSGQYIEDVFNFWFNEAVNEIISYIRERMGVS